MISFTVDGKSIECPEGANLMEVLWNQNDQGLKQPYKRAEVSGFCHHPLIESSKKCLLCSVYDEKTKKLVKACERNVAEADAFLVDDERVSLAREEIKDVYFKGHDFHCTSCKNQGQCHLHGNLGVGHPRKVNQISPQGEMVESVRLNEFLSLDTQECINCSLCSDFEKAVSDKPALSLMESGLVVNGGIGHNLVDAISVGVK